MKQLLCCLLLLVLSCKSYALKPEDLLPPDQAFQFSAEVIDENLVQLTWDIAEGYYLYRERFNVSTETAGIQLNADDFRFPKGDLKNDPNFGELEVYHDQVAIEIPLERAQQGLQAIELQLQAKYQGCADAGLCYPPQRKTASLQLA
ncbi:MAG: protein-disulfide reductase DsbD family protein, partial [Thiolinea sp.]